MNLNPPYRLRPVTESDYPFILSNHSLWRFFVKDLAAETGPLIDKFMMIVAATGLPVELVVGKLATLGYWSTLNNMRVH